MRTIGIVVGVVGLAFLTVARLAAEPVVTSDVDTAPISIKPPFSLIAPALPAAVAVVPQKTEAEKNLEAQLAEAQAQLKEKDALIAKLSDHLGSALARLNRVQSPLSDVNSSMAALGAAKLKLEQQNNALKAKEEILNARMAELTKQKQLFDLENRQLFEALNGRPYKEDHRDDKVLPAKYDRGNAKTDKELLGEL